MTEYEIIVFDFDGTLVESNEAKRRAFFALFENELSARLIMEQVLNEFPEESRYRLIEETLRRTNACTEGELPTCVEHLGERYGDAALEAVRNCPEKAGVSEVLCRLSGSHTLYLSSGTPVESLRELVSARPWGSCFTDIFGYPARKSDTLKLILQREAADAQSMLVVGDGESDRRSAEQVGCGFFHAGTDDSMFRLRDGLFQ